MDFADWFLYDHGLHQERVKEKFLKKKKHYKWKFMRAYRDRELTESILHCYKESLRINITKCIFKKINKKLKALSKANKEVANVKSSNNKSINSLLIGGTITTNTKLIANHFDTFLKVLLLNLMKRLLELKNDFTLSWTDC